MQAGEVTTIMLDPLPDGAVRDLFGDRPLAEAMLRQAAGSPFTVTEVAAALARQDAIARDHDQRWRLRPARDAAGVAEVVAAGLAEAATNRLAGLPARSRDMLGLLALLGRPAPAALLAAASGAGLRAALDTLEGLAGAGLVRAGTQGWALSHELAGQAIRGTMSPAGTTRSHALLAGALRQCGVDPAEIAGHLSASGDRAGAATAYAAAARSQLERISDLEAARLAEAGLSLDPPGRTRAALLEVRGEAGRRGGRLEAARGDFTAALDSLDDPAGRSRVLACLAILDARTAGAARGGELAELAIADAGSQPDTLGQALAAGAIIDLADGNLARAHDRWHRARRLLDQAGDSRGGARLLYWQAMAGFIGGRLRDAVSQLDRLARLPAGNGEILRLWSPRATRGQRPRLPRPGRRRPRGDRRDPRLGPRRPAPCRRGRVPLAPQRGPGHRRPGRRGDRIRRGIGGHRHPHRARRMDRGRAPRPGRGLRGRGAARPRRIRLPPLRAGLRGPPVLPGMGRRAARAPAWPARDSPARRPRMSAPRWQAERRSPDSRPAGRTPSSSPAAARTTPAARSPPPRWSQPGMAAT